MPKPREARPARLRLTFHVLRLTFHVVTSISALQWSDVMPKTYKHLYPKICAFENLYQAHRKARRGGKRKRPEVAAFEHDLGENLLRLREELLAQTYRPGAYHNFIVIERKERKISAAPYRDRVVHHALINVIGPIFEARFIHDTYANREGKGTHAALDRAQYFARRHPYVLQCDVREFFPSIDHAILQGLLARHIACPLRNRNNNRGISLRQHVSEGIVPRCGALTGASNSTR
jgi:retron-type reverse transcriptase